MFLKRIVISLKIGWRILSRAELYLVRPDFFVRSSSLRRPTNVGCLSSHVEKFSMQSLRAVPADFTVKAPADGKTFKLSEAMWIALTVGDGQRVSFMVSAVACPSPSS